ncbi:MAG TPA: helix-turn-helix domain-containing protein [Solirubrobacteraceae bacterium]|jgi:hypothetical protein
MNSGVGVGVVVARLRARREEIEEAIFLRVRDVVPDGASDGDVAYVMGLRGAVAGALEFVLTGIERGEAGSGPIPPATVMQARRAVRSGVGLGTVLRRYTAGYALLGDFVLEQAQSSNVERELRELLAAQASSFERLTATVAEEYGRELERAASSPARRRVEIVQRLLAGGAPPQLAAELGCELEGWHLGGIAHGAGATDALEELRAALRCRLLCVSPGEGVAWGWLSGGQRRIEAAEVERLVRAGGWRDSVSLAVGEPGQRFVGWRATHQQAQAAYMVMQRDPRPFIRYGDVALLAAALKDQTLARVLLDIYLLPLRDPRSNGAVLRETLHAYCATGRNVSSAASTLNVARSTVESRLRTIEGRLGRTLHPCPPELEVALHLDRLTHRLPHVFHL